MAARSCHQRIGSASWHRSAPASGTCAESLSRGNHSSRAKPHLQPTHSHLSESRRKGCEQIVLVSNILKFRLIYTPHQKISLPDGIAKGPTRLAATKSRSFSEVDFVLKTQERPSKSLEFQLLHSTLPPLFPPYACPRCFEKGFKLLAWFLSLCLNRTRAKDAPLRLLSFSGTKGIPLKNVKLAPRKTRTLTNF